MDHHKEIPRRIYSIVNDVSGVVFDAEYFQNLNKGMVPVVAFEELLDEIREFFPFYRKNTSYESYRWHLYCKAKKKTIVIPIRVIEMVNDQNKMISQYFIELNNPKCKSREQAYNKVMSDIWCHFPGYRKFVDFRSFKNYLVKMGVKRT